MGRPARRGRDADSPGQALPCHAVVCLPNDRLPLATWATEAGGPVTGPHTGHNCMVTAPEELTAAIVKST